MESNDKLLEDPGKIPEAIDMTTSRPSEKFNTFLYFSAITANLATFTLGGSYAWSSPAISRLNGQIDVENNPLSQNILPNEESWIASLFPLGAAISTFLYGYLSERIGRKYTLLASSIPTIAGLILLTFASAVSHFYIGRLLCGIGSGAVFTVIPIYVGEIAESTNRGVLGCFLLFFITVGNLHIYLLAPYVTLKILTASNLIVPVIFLIVFTVFVPESPYYYVSKNKIDMAEKALLKLRFNNIEIVKKELSIIIKTVENSFTKKIGIKEIYNDKVIIKAFGISIGLVCFQQWSGINAVFFYMQSIFEESGSGISSDNCSIIAGFVQFLTCAFAMTLVDRYGRRFLLITSAIGNVLVLFVGGTYFYLKENTSLNVDDINWLPVVAVNLFLVTYTIGFGPVTFAMIGELFPPYIKSFAATISIFVCLFCTFCVTNIFPYFKSLMGIGVTFYFLGIICCAGGIFVYIRVPETKGKRLEEIQELIMNWNKNRK